MKIESCSIERFKLFDQYDLQFTNAALDEISDRFCILGDNGSGKTSLLQAIALTLAMATGRIRSVSEFDWIGFLPERYTRSGLPRIAYAKQNSKFARTCLGVVARVA